MAHIRPTSETVDTTNDDEPENRWELAKGEYHPAEPITNRGKSSRSTDLARS